MSNTMQETSKKKAAATTKRAVKTATKGTLKTATKGEPKTAARRTRKTTTKELRLPSHDEIAARARQLFEASGHAGGRDAEFWLEAERQLSEELNT